MNEGTLKNNYLYNDKEFFDDGDLDWYDYGFRNYDPQIGRFTQLDPLTDEYPYYTPYQFAGNDPIANVDIDGLEPLLSNLANAAGFVAQNGAVLGHIDDAVVTSSSLLSGVIIFTGPKVFETVSKITNVVNNTGRLLKDLKVATEWLGIATKTVSVTAKGMQRTLMSGDLRNSFRIPDQRQLALNNYGQALDKINDDWHPMDVGMKESYGLPEGGKVNWSTGQISPNPTNVEMTDGPETWIPIVFSGFVFEKIGADIVEEGVAEGGIAYSRNMGNAMEKALGMSGSKTAINVGGRTRFPDRLANGLLEESKNVNHLNFTSQIRDYLKYSQENGLDFILHTRSSTTFSKPLKELIDKKIILHNPVPGF